MNLKINKEDFFEKKPYQEIKENYISFSKINHSSSSFSSSPLIQKIKIKKKQKKFYSEYVY